MAAVANIVINDGQATPVAHTFEPTRVSPNLVSYHDKVSGVFAGYPSISLGNRVPNKQNANYKASARIRLPVLETAAPATSGFTPGPTVAYALSGNVDCVIPDRATDAEKADLEAYLQNLISQAVSGDLVTEMALPY